MLPLALVVLRMGKLRLVRDNSQFEIDTHDEPIPVPPDIEYELITNNIGTAKRLAHIS
jgi:hypothetical protein